MAHIFKMNMGVRRAFDAQGAWVGGGIKAAQEYGKNVAAMIPETE